MDILKIGLVAVIGVLLAVPLKSYKAEYVFISELPFAWCYLAVRLVIFRIL